MTQENVTAGQPLTAQEIGQMIDQSQDALMAKLSGMLSGITTKQATEEVLSDPGLDEFSKIMTENMMTNAKRTYDEYQEVGLESIRRSRTFADQIIQNAITLAKQLDAQSVRHHDLAIDRQWNVDEQGYTSRSILSDEVFKDAIKEAVVEAVQAVKA